MWHIGKYAIAFISIHAPARGATQECVEIIEKIKISIHAPARGATQCLIFWNLKIAISIHAPARGATMGYAIERFRSVISIHAPARGATDYDTVNFWQARDFNPRSREGSDAYELSQPTGYNISIHAPARGATLSSQHVSTSKLISIHAPARGATTSISIFIKEFVNFNPRSREGSDGKNRQCDN